MLFVFLLDHVYSFIVWICFLFEVVEKLSIDGLFDGDVVDGWSWSVCVETLSG
jgi:hypothetical protein